MTTPPAISALELLSPLRLGGPLLERELRVSSRRGRTYLLRITYVAIMCLFALGAWYSIMGLPLANIGSFSVSRSSLVGQRVTTSILWFQFMGAQLIAMAMLSSPLGDEINKGGLDILLSTPLSSVQIVLGKLLSRLWQVILLLTISLPALAVVRVMGGVSWGLVVSSLCITLAASVFVGALCLWMSTYFRHPFQVVSAASVVYLVVFIGVPAAIQLTASVAGLNQSLVPAILTAVSPRSAFYALMGRTSFMRINGSQYVPSWTVHCLIMLGLTVLILALCAWRIRRASARTVGAAARRSRPMWHQPPTIGWQALMGGCSRRDCGRLLAIGGVVAVCALIVGGRIALGRQIAVYAGDIAWAFEMIVLLRLATLAGAAIGREKDGRTLPLLLTTPLDERQIVRGKLRVLIHRGLPWVLAAFAVKACYMACIVERADVLIALCYPIGVLASALFVIAAGLYFGARLRTTTAAVIATVGMYLFLHYLAAGYYSPIWVWLRYKILLRPGAGRATLALFTWGMFLAVRALEISLGLALLHRTRGSLRRYV